MGDKQGFTEADLRRAFDWVYRKRQVEPHSGPTVDVNLLMKHGIPFHMEYADLVLVSSDGMRRARAAGIVNSPHLKPLPPK